MAHRARPLYVIPMSFVQSRRISRFSEAYDSRAIPYRRTLDCMQPSSAGVQEVDLEVHESLLKREQTFTL